MKFTGKTAVITGAASGIGRATTRALIERDISVLVAVDRNEIIIIAVVHGSRQPGFWRTRDRS